LTTTEDNKRVIRRFVDEVINRKNLDAIDEIVAEDFIEHIPFPGQGPGREGLRYAISLFISAFPDLHWVLEEQTAEAERVVSRFTMTGTHRGELLGIPPTGRSIEIVGVVFDVVRDGMFAESRILMDMPGLLQQLSV